MHAAGDQEVADSLERGQVHGTGLGERRDRSTDDAPRSRLPGLLLACRPLVRSSLCRAWRGIRGPSPGCSRPGCWPRGQPGGTAASFAVMVMIGRMAALLTSAAKAAAASLRAYWCAVSGPVTTAPEASNSIIAG